MHEAAGPAYGSTGANHKVVDPGEGVREGALRAAHARPRHVDIDGEVMQIDGLGLRDHSWGPRYWQAIHSYRWLTINFAPDFGMMVSTVWRDPEHRTQGGVVIRGDKMDQIVGVDIDTRVRGQRPLPQGPGRAPQAEHRRAARRDRQGDGLHPAAQPPRGHDHARRRRHDRVPLRRRRRLRPLASTSTRSSDVESPRRMAEPR